MIIFAHFRFFDDFRNLTRKIIDLIFLRSKLDSICRHVSKSSNTFRIGYKNFVFCLKSIREWPK